MVGFLPLTVSLTYDPNHPFLPPTASLAEARKLIVEQAVRIVPLVYEDSMQLDSVLYRSTLLEASSATTLSMEARELAEQPKVTVDPSTPLTRALNLMLEADEWYSIVVESTRYRGVLGFEHVVAYALRDDRLREALSSKTVAEAMTRNPISVAPDDPVYRAWQTMLSKRIAALPVVNSKGRLVGVVAEYDLLKAGYARPRLEARKHVAKGPRVSTVMSTPAVALRPSDPLLEAASVIVRRGIGRVYVVDEEGRLVGVVDREDIVKTLLPHIETIQ